MIKLFSSIFYLCRSKREQFRSYPLYHSKTRLNRSVYQFYESIGRLRLIDRHHVYQLASAHTLCLTNLLKNIRSWAGGELYSSPNSCQPLVRNFFQTLDSYR